MYNNLLIYVLVSSILFTDFAHSTESNINEFKNLNEENTNPINPGNTDTDDDRYDSLGRERLKFEPHSYLKVEQSFKLLGNVERKKPVVSNEGNGPYPVYGTVLSLTTEQKQTLLYENSDLRANTGIYDSMDENGTLYLNGTSINQTLYKHTAADGMYYGNISDDEPAVIKEITVRCRPLGNYITGLYAPPGEVIKIEISEEDLKATGGVNIVIGQISQSNKANSIGIGKNFCRMPAIINIMTIKTTVGYAGYALGGPIYFYPVRTCTQFTVRISGAVEFTHFIYGLTTREEFERLKKLPCPYFEAEVWDNCIRHSGPKLYANLDYDELTSALELWYKISLVSKQIPCLANNKFGITFLYDPYIAAGAACSFAGADYNYVNCPPNWMSGGLSYANFIKTGSWGNIHEFNHQYQEYGLPNGGEVTNNAINILSYVLYTDVSSARSESDNTLGSWNAYTDPSRSLRFTLDYAANNTVQYSLNAYVDIIHSFGVDKFIKATEYAPSNKTVDAWYKSLCSVIKYDFTYYFENILHLNITDSVKEEQQALKYPVFVPVSCLYQVGRSYMEDGIEVFTETVKPFIIEKAKPFTIDFNQRLLFPPDFNFTIKSISQPENGRIKKVSENVYKYIPGIKKYSGNIKVVVSLSHETIQTPDVTLVLNFKQAITLYTTLCKCSQFKYDSIIYLDPAEALKNNFAGFTENVTTSVNTHVITYLNQKYIKYIEGKFIIPETGTYVMGIASARCNCSIYISRDEGRSYELAMTASDNRSYYDITENRTVRLNLTQGEQLYFKEVSISTGANSFLEIGWATVPDETSVPDIRRIAVSNLKGFNYVKIPCTFTSPSPYSRRYPVTSLTYNLPNQKCISVTHGPWDNTRLIEFGIDQDKTTSYHSARNVPVNAANPFVLVVDLGKEIEANEFVIYGYTGSSLQMPVTFDLYGGLTEDSMELLGSYVDHNAVNRINTVNFEKTKLRYYKLNVTKTSPTYVAFMELEMRLSFNGEEFSPDYMGYIGFDVEYTISTFGHFIRGNGEATYCFNGTQFGLFVVQDSECKIEVDVDGEVKEYIVTETNGKEVGFLTDEMEFGEHHIKIHVLEGELVINSILQS